ncbi:hypothetical protein AAMO2058_000957700, partial [Amorphochlora amoebiformis]
MKDTLSDNSVEGQKNAPQTPKPGRKPKKAPPKGETKKKSEAKTQPKKKPKKKQPPRSVAEWIKASKKSYRRLRTFHDLYYRKDCAQVLMAVKRSNMDRIFFPQLTLRGLEGRLPDMWDATPKHTGLSFRVSPNGRSLLLVENQPAGSKIDLASSIYSKATGGTNEGFIRMFQPLVIDKKQGETLIDLTAWLFGFSNYAFKANQRGGMGSQMTIIEDIKAYPQNFLFRMAAQRRSSEPLK